MDGNDAKRTGKCPVMHGGNTSYTTHPTRWWPNALNLDILHQHGARANPMDVDYNHREAVKKLDFKGVWNDVDALLTDSQEWWPVHPPVLARGRFLPSGRWPRRRRLGQYPL